eukprot:CAMPEP_0116887376 /NCGR_PEP_ID=MMETSP0463-20121206/21831_1 /TAXON_ID=181622 /ORGANISM="Strombidinopsis sp, Strain SopsisLIS2011" /LENGTH=107 /DNA_ID=CAMNT_0004549945 /DNA_START=691 /DNA_END=1014 /DNA_ORIENTATION=-
MNAQKNLFDQFSEEGQAMEDDIPDIDFKNDAEMYESHDLEQNANKIHQWIGNNRYEIENTLTDYNWLHMYADSIRAYNLDFSEAMRQTITQEEFDKGSLLRKAQETF